MEILAIILKEIPFGEVNKEIFAVVEEINNQNIDKQKLLFAKLKIKNLLGNLDLNHKDKIIEKILKFINNSKIKEILKLRLEDNYEKILKEM